MNRHHFRPAWGLVLVLAAFALTINACSSSDDSDPVTPVPTPLPLVIDDLNTVAGTDASVTVSWTSPPLMNKADIRYDLRYIGYGSEDTAWDSWTVAPAPSSDPSSGQSRTHEVTGLAADQTYSISMKASTDGTNWSTSSNIAVGTADQNFDITPPADIQGLMLYKSTGTSLTVAWPPTGDDGIYGEPESYEVRYSLTTLTPGNWFLATEATGAVTESALPDMLETTITGLDPDQEYYVAVKALDDEGLVSDQSNVLSAPTVDLQTIYVNVDGTGDYPTIEEAIHAATPGDLILVGPGHYTWTNQGTGRPYLEMIHVQRDQTDFEVRSIAGPEETVLDAQKQGNIITVTGGSFGDVGDRDFAGITIDGFTFTNGKVTGPAPPEQDPTRGYAGGGLTLHLTDSVVRNCIFTGNEATEGGGLWHGGQGGPIIENCLFENNKAGIGGGLMMVNCEQRITVRNCVMRDNHSTFAGGGLFAGNVLVTMENLLIVGNDSSDKGGGVSFSGLHDDCWLINCTIVDNDGFLGSAVRLADNTKPRIHGSLIAFNTGGAAFSAVVYSTVDVSCTLVYGHDQGNQFPSNYTDSGGNLETDPLFCDREDYLLQGNSPCLPGNHPDGGDCLWIGGRGEGCDP